MRELFVPMSLGSRRKPSEIVTRSSRLLPSGIPFRKGLEQLRLSVEQLSDMLILGLMGGWFGWGCQFLDYLGHVGVLEGVLDCQWVDGRLCSEFVSELIFWHRLPILLRRGSSWMLTGSMAGSPIASGGRMLCLF